MQDNFELVPAVKALMERNATYLPQGCALLEVFDVDIAGMQIANVFYSDCKEVLTAQKDGKGYVIEGCNFYQIFTNDEILEAAEKITEILDKFLNAEYEADSYSDYVIFAKKFLEAADKIDNDVKENEMAKAKQKKSCANTRQDKDK